MKQKYTHDQFVEVMKEKHPDIEVIGRYINTGTPVKIRHSCGYEWDGHPNNLMYGRSCPKCNHAIRMTHEDFAKRMDSIGIDVLSEYTTNKDPVKIRFRNCRHEHTATPRDLSSGKGCPYCASRKLLVGFNDIATKTPWMVEYLANKEDSEKYMPRSSRKILFKCPECGNEETKTIGNVFMFGFHCSACSDGNSYPNKFSIAFLKQLPIDNMCNEYAPDWANGRRYDNYFEYQGKKYILEMDGGFHYKDDKFTPLEEVKKIDAMKDEMAMAHDIIMIRIECRKSNKEYISNNIKNSILGEIFDLSNIDWDKCDSVGNTSKIKEVCLYYEEHKIDMMQREIAKNLNIGVSTLQHYVKIGINAGWCISSDEERRKIDSIHKTKARSKPLILFDNDHNKIAEFAVSLDCANYLSSKYDGNFNDRIVRAHCRSGKPYKGFYFEYKNNIN